VALPENFICRPYRGVSVQHWDGPLDEGAVTVAAELDLAAYAANSRRTSPRIHDPAVKQRVAGVTDRDLKRTSLHTVRRGQQVRLPLYPTTTIGSFPQTAEVRKARKELGDGTLTRDDPKQPMLPLRGLPGKATA